MFGNRQANSTRVGGPLSLLYGELAADQRPTFKESLAKAPSGSEIVAYFNASPAAGQVLLEAFRDRKLRKACAVGMEVLGPHRVAIYIKGDLPEGAFAELERRCEQIGRDTGFGAGVAYGRFGPEQLRELR